MSQSTFSTTGISSSLIRLVIIIGILVFIAPQVQAATVTISPGQDIQAVVDANPAGTKYILESGVHRLQQIYPNKGDTFEGEPGTILNGSTLLDTWNDAGGGIWYATGQTQSGQVHGSCEDDYPRCSHPEALFVNDTPIKHVADLGDVDATSYFFDYDADRIYIGQDPAGKTIEVATTRVAFGPSADDVTIRNMIIEKYASPNQMGAIGDQHPKSGWLIENNEVRLNHGTGVHIGSGTILRNNHIHRNGQNGVGATGIGGLIEGNIIANNDRWNGNRTSWGGGTKFANTERLTVRNNYVHTNAAPGLWTDIENYETVYEYNTVKDNDDAGFKHEISYDAVIRNNIAIGNGVTDSNWLWNGNVEIQNSPNVEVHNNYIEVEDGTTSHAVSIIEQGHRGSGSRGPYVCSNTYVHENTVVFGQKHRKQGAVQDYGNEDFWTPAWNIRFEDNDYYAPEPWWYFAWNHVSNDFATWQSFGFDLTGSFSYDAPPPAPAPIVSISASSTNITEGESTLLTFEGLLATECTAPWKSGDWVSGDIVVSPTTTTTYTITCTGEGGVVAENIEISVTPAPITYAVNFGGGAFTDSNGIDFEPANTYASGGAGNVYNTADPIANTTDDTLYQSERYGAFTYEFPVANGNYDVTMMFAELYHTSNGSRVFDVDIEGVTVLDNLDIYSEAGHDTAYNVDIPVSVTDGSLTVETKTVNDNPKISALTISPTPEPTLFFAAEDTTVKQSEATLLTWSANHATSCSSNDLAVNDTSGSIGVFPLENTTYRVDCTGPGGTVFEQVTIEVTDITYVQSSYGSAHTLPTKLGEAATIETEDFDNGGNRIGYYDDSNGNTGSEYRSTDVDIETTGDATGDFNIGWTKAGEWLEYTLEAPKGGAYNLGLRVANPAAGAEASVLIDDVEVADFSIPNTGGYQNYTTLEQPGITISRGTHVLRLSLDTNAGNNLVGNFNFITLTATSFNPEPIVELTATEPSINVGLSTELSWNVQNATSCTASGGWSGNKGMSGAETVSPNASTTYSLTCSGEGGDTTTNVSLEVIGKAKGGSRRFLRQKTIVEETVHKAAPAKPRSCHGVITGSKLPYDFSAPWNADETNGQLLLSAKCHENGFTIDAGTKNSLVYKRGYQWQNDRWEAFLFTEDAADEHWIEGTAHVTIAEKPKSRFVLAYVCTEQNVEWDCGCEDEGCRSNWRLQEVRY
jgi:hypothetical protein